jgi:hypothetical protein
LHVAPNNGDPHFSELFSVNFHANLLRPWRFPLTSKGGVCVFSAKQILLNKYNDWKDAKNK